jgi:hypothetical protein
VIRLILQNAWGSARVQVPAELDRVAAQEMAELVERLLIGHVKKLKKEAATNGGEKA